MAEKRQEGIYHNLFEYCKKKTLLEYQALLKSLIIPADNVREELSKAKHMESKWQRECQQLVMKLDLEVIS